MVGLIVKGRLIFGILQYYKERSEFLYEKLLLRLPLSIFKSSNTMRNVKIIKNLQENFAFVKRFISRLLRSLFDTGATL